MSKGWDNATLKKLKALTGKGLSTAEIGKRLGLSKNAVVGKLNRMGWNAKASTTTEKKKAAATPAKKAVVASASKKTPVKATAKKAAVATTKKSAPKAAPVKKAETVPAKKATAAPKPKSGEKKSLTKTLAMHQRIIQHSLEMASLKPNQCRWPIGDPDSENFHFCGEQVFVGKPYCYEHCKQAYQFTPPKKK